MSGTYDDGEAFDATDTGDDIVADGTAAILYAQLLEDLYAAGFREEPATGGFIGKAGAILVGEVGPEIFFRPGGA